MYGINSQAGTFSLGMFFSKPGDYYVPTASGGTFHIGWDNQASTYYNFSIMNGSSQYYSPNKFNYNNSVFTPGFYMISCTADSSSGNNTTVNVHAYPNVDITFNNTNLNLQNRPDDLHTWNIGYWDFNAAKAKRSLNSSIGEVMYFNRILTNDERYILEGKIAWKYNQAAILPSFHPYKTISPL
jgi:hypothetical protein